MTPDRRCKVIKVTLADVWKQGCIIRINNFGDKEKTPHLEKDIKNQVRLRHVWCFCCLRIRNSAADFHAASNSISKIEKCNSLEFPVLSFFCTAIIRFKIKANALGKFATFRNMVSLWWSTTGHPATAGSWNAKLFL